MALLVRALQRSRAPLAPRLPSRAEVSALLDTFGLLTVFYICKNMSYLLLQVLGIVIVSGLCLLCASWERAGVEGW